MQRRGAQYKHRHDKKIHIEPKLAPNHRVFVDKSPLAGSRITADGVEIASYNKLYPRTAGPFHVLKVQSHTLCATGIWFIDTLLETLSSSITTVSRD